MLLFFRKCARTHVQEISTNSVCNISLARRDENVHAIYPATAGITMFVDYCQIFWDTLKV